MKYDREKNNAESESQKQRPGVLDHRRAGRGLAFLWPAPGRESLPRQQSSGAGSKDSETQHHTQLLWDSLHNTLCLSFLICQ